MSSYFDAVFDYTGSDGKVRNYLVVYKFKNNGKKYFSIAFFKNNNNIDGVTFSHLSIVVNEEQLSKLTLNKELTDLTSVKLSFNVFYGDEGNKDIDVENILKDFNTILSCNTSKPVKTEVKYELTTKRGVPEWVLL